MGRFVIPDLHGRDDLLEKMLEKWNPTTHKLVQLGDMVDRGANSLKVIQKLKRLNEEGKVTVIKGNHEIMFLNFLDYPELEGKFYIDSGGCHTIDSFLGKEISYRKTPRYIADSIKEKYIEEIEFIKGLPFYTGWRDWVFAHGGIDFNQKDWHNTSDNDFSGMQWQRFVYPKNEHPFNFVIGHIHTKDVNEDKGNQPCVSGCKTKFMLDGDAIKGQLNALVINNDNTYHFEMVK